MDLFYCNKCKVENIYYLIKKKGNCYLLRNCCYEKFKTNYELKKLKNISFPINFLNSSNFEKNKKSNFNYQKFKTYKEDEEDNDNDNDNESLSSQENFSDIDIENEEINDLDNIVVNINEFINKLSFYKENDNNLYFNINEFNFTEGKNNEKINFKEFKNMHNNNYHKNILDVEKYLKDLEILKNEKREFFINKYNKEKEDLENKFNQLMISFEKKYNDYKYNIEIFLKYYKSINELLININKKVDNNYLNSLNLNLNIYTFNNFDKLFSEFKNEEKLEYFVRKLNIYDNFIVKRKKLYEFIKNNRAFKIESYIYNANKKKSDDYLYESKIDVLFEKYKEKHPIFYNYNNFIYFKDDALYFNNLILEDNKESKSNSFMFFEKHYLKFENEIKKIMLLKNDKILIICDKEDWPNLYIELFLISIDLKTEKMIIEKSFKVEKIKFQDCQQLNVSNKILIKIKDEKLKFIIFDVINFPKEKKYNFKDICDNYYNNIIGYKFKNIKTEFSYRYINFIIEIKKNILFIDNFFKRYVFSLEDKQFITIIDKSESMPDKKGLRKYIYAEYDYIYYIDSILIFEQNSNKIPWNRISYFIDIKTFKKIENNVPISDGNLIKLSKNKFAIINNYNLTIYIKVGIKLQIYEFYTFQFNMNEIKLKLEFSYNHLITKKFIHTLFNNGYHPELKTSEIDYIELDLNLPDYKGSTFYPQKEYRDIEKFMKCDLIYYKVKSGFIYLLKNYPKTIIKISKY